MSVVHLPWPDVQVPAYAPGRHGRWTIGTTKGAMPGYFTPEVIGGESIALHRKERGKNITWMSLVQMEKESHMPHIAAATGHTVVMGLGMGMYLYNILPKSEVTNVTVVERDRSVIELFENTTEWRKWPGAHKLRIVEHDAKTWTPGNARVDFLYADFWKQMGDTKAMPGTRACLRNVRPLAFGYWTQEFDFLKWRIDNKIPAMDAGHSSYNRFAEFVKDGVQSRMVGEDDPRYALLATIANYIQTCVACREDAAMAALVNRVVSDLIEKYNKTYPKQELV